MRPLRFIAILAAAALPALVSGQEEDAAWIPLFDGSSLEHWQTAEGESVTEGWVIEDGVLHRKSKGGDLLSKETFEDFELVFEWKIGEGANSGVKYRFGDHEGKMIGPEYQLLDDAAHPDTARESSTASLYHVLPPNDRKALKSGESFNQSRIVARGNRLQHWLNGALVLEADLDSDAWAAALKDSKFRGVTAFGRRPGRILLQDHGGIVWFKSLRIRRLVD